MADWCDVPAGRGASSLRRGGLEPWMMCVSWFASRLARGRWARRARRASRLMRPMTDAQVNERLWPGDPIDLQAAGGLESFDGLLGKRPVATVNRPRRISRADQTPLQRAHPF